MNTSEVIVGYLQAAGIRHVFGYPGDPSVEFLEAGRVHHAGRMADLRARDDAARSQIVLHRGHAQSGL